MARRRSDATGREYHYTTLVARGIRWGGILHRHRGHVQTRKNRSDGRGVGLDPSMVLDRIQVARAHVGTTLLIKCYWWMKSAMSKNMDVKLVIVDLTTRAEHTGRGC